VPDQDEPEQGKHQQRDAEHLPDQDAAGEQGDALDPDQHGVEDEDDDEDRDRRLGPHGATVTPRAPWETFGIGSAQA
jgi:hypothetical protein